MGEVIDTLKDVGERYHSQLVFQHKYPAGYVLWQGGNAFLSKRAELSNSAAYPMDSRVLINQSIQLGDLSKLKNGIQVHVNSAVLQYNTHANGWSLLPSQIYATFQTTVNVPNADIANGSPIQIGSSIVAIVNVQVDSSGAVYFTSINADTEEVLYQNSTRIYAETGTPDYALIIDSITAY